MGRYLPNLGFTFYSGLFVASPLLQNLLGRKMQKVQEINVRERQTSRQCCHISGFCVETKIVNKTPFWTKSLEVFLSFCFRYPLLSDFLGLNLKFFFPCHSSVIENILVVFVFSVFRFLRRSDCTFTFFSKGSEHRVCQKFLLKVDRLCVALELKER